MIQLDPDNFGRSVTLDTVDNVDVYVVMDEAGNSFRVERPSGTPIDLVYNTINAMGPPG